MSLLPGRIIPQDVSLGTVNPDGTVTIDKDWWLLLYNLCAQTLGTTGTSGTILPVDDQTILTEVDDATKDGNDAAAADLERLTTLDEPQTTTAAADIAELQALSASFAEDPIIGRFTAQWDGLVPASGGGTAKYLRADGWNTLPTPAGSANPSASIGLAAVDGTATTFMTSDSAPPLSQAIVPTWSGLHTFSAAIVASAGLHTYSGATASTASGTAVNLQALSNTGYGTYLVSAAISAAGDAANYSAVSLVCTNGAAAKIIALQTAGLLTITLSGATVQATQNSGASAVINYSILRVA